MFKKKKHPSKKAAFILVLHDCLAGEASIAGEVVATYTTANKRHWDATATVKGLTHRAVRCSSAKRAVDVLNNAFNFASTPLPTSAPRAMRQRTPPTVDNSNLAELKGKARQQMVESFAKAKQLFPNMTIELPTLNFNKRGVVAGTARYSTNTISLNAVYLVENGDKFIKDTVPHELAHLVAYNVYGQLGHGHGRYWKSVMRKLGFEPTRTHNYDPTNARVRQVQRFEIACGCETTNYGTIGPLRAKRLRNGTGYTCTKCNCSIKLV